MFSHCKKYFFTITKAFTSCYDLFFPQISSDINLKMNSEKQVNIDSVLLQYPIDWFHSCFKLANFCKAICFIFIKHIQTLNKYESKSGDDECEEGQSTSLCLEYGCVLSHFSHSPLFVALFTIVSQASLSMGFFSQEYWSGLPLPILGIFLT